MDDATIERIYDKIEEVGRQVSAVAIDVAVLKSRPLYKQPCDGLKLHLDDHSDCKRDWRQAFISAVAKIVIAAIIAAFGFQYGFSKAEAPRKDPPPTSSHEAAP